MPSSTALEIVRRPARHAVPALTVPRCASGCVKTAVAACSALVNLDGPYAAGLPLVPAATYYAACLASVCATGPTVACPQALMAYEDALRAADVLRVPTPLRGGARV